jgi:hypothetical protein
MQASSRRGSARNMQPIVFKLLKTCVDTHAPEGEGWVRGWKQGKCVVLIP